MCHIKINVHIHTYIYGTAQFKLDIYMSVALESFKFVKPLASYTRAHDTMS